MHKKKDVLVSVVMITYNHEKYIKQAIEGVLMQKTDFDVELILSNDCSTDQTDKVIKAVLKEHQGKHNIKVRYYNHLVNKGSMENFIWSMQQAQGKYIALCEGDDYWTDPYKLQKQVDFLERNENVSMCFTNGIIYDVKSKSKINTLYNYKSGIIDKYNFIKKGSSAFITASIMIKKKVVDKFLLDNNRFTFNIGDLPLMLFSCIEGEIGYINDITCVYRLNTPNSWTEKHQNYEDIYKNIKHSIKIVNYYRNLSTDKKFKLATKSLIQNYYSFLILEKDKFENYKIIKLFFLLRHFFKLNYKHFIIHLNNILLPK